MMSIDTGMSESIFSKHYFDMNRRHLDGLPYRVSLDMSMLYEDDHVLTIHPKGSKGQQTQSDL